MASGGEQLASCWVHMQCKCTMKYDDKYNKVATTRKEDLDRCSPFPGFCHASDNVTQLRRCCWLQTPFEDLCIGQGSTASHSLQQDMMTSATYLQLSMYM